MIGIIDYGMGNLRSVQKACEYVGQKAFIISDYREFGKADQLILPGVGAFKNAIATIRQKSYDQAIAEAISRKKPLMGICLGMQLLFDQSCENGQYEGLGLLPGRIVKFPSALKIPHMGWNTLEVQDGFEALLFKGLPREPFMYFVHSYYLETDAPIVSARTDYGKSIAVAVQKGCLFGLQFHPEKSGDMGLLILKNFGGLWHEDLSGN